MLSPYTYADKKLSAARRSLMLPHPSGEAHSIAAAFMECDHGLHDIQDHHLDDNSRDWIRKIRELMNTEGIEPGKSGSKGTWELKAETLSVDERNELSECVDELAHWFDRRTDEDYYKAVPPT